MTPGPATCGASCGRRWGTGCCLAYRSGRRRGAQPGKAPAAASSLCSCGDTTAPQNPQHKTQEQHFRTISMRHRNRTSEPSAHNTGTGLQNPQHRTQEQHFRTLSTGHRSSFLAGGLTIKSFKYKNMTSKQNIVFLRMVTKQGTQINERMQISLNSSEQ